MRALALALLLALACGGPDLTGVPAAGDECDCDHEGAYWYTEDQASGERTTLVVCRDITPAPTCEQGTRTDAGLSPCDGVTIYFGACAWENP